MRPNSTGRPNGNLDPPWMPGTVLKLEEIWPKLDRKTAIIRARREVAGRRLAILPNGRCTPADIWLATQAGVPRRIMMERGMIADHRDPDEIRRHKMAELEREHEMANSPEGREAAQRAAELRRVAKYPADDLDARDEEDLRELFKREFPHKAQQDPDGVDALSSGDLRYALLQVKTTTGEDTSNTVDLEGGHMADMS